MRMSGLIGLRRLAATSNQAAIANARTASIELSRRRVEREEVELFLRARTVPVLRPVAAPRPA